MSNDPCAVLLLCPDQRAKSCHEDQEDVSPLSFKARRPGEDANGRGLFTSNTVPRHLTSISLPADVSMLTRCTLTFTFLFFRLNIFFKVHCCFWLLWHLHRNYVGLTLIFPAIPTRS